MMFGLEKEFFVFRNNSMIVVPDTIPADDCYMLAEARGVPADNIVDAVYNLLADIHRLNEKAQKEGVFLDDTPVYKVSIDMKIRAARLSDKGRLRYQNIYGFNRHANKINELCSGVHISFTNQRTFDYYYPIGTKKNDYRKSEKTYTPVWDFAQVIRILDKEFSIEIKNAKRKPGFYEIKRDESRIEYRSLPSNVDLNKVIDVVSAIDFNEYV